MNNKYEYTHELWSNQIESISKSPNEWMSFLKTSAWMYKFSFDDQLLIYAQRPDARACASYETWNDKLHRWIKRGSKGIALLNENGTLRYVFDISDTRSPVLNRILYTPCNRKLFQLAISIKYKKCNFLCILLYYFFIYRFYSLCYF